MPQEDSTTRIQNIEVQIDPSIRREVGKSYVVLDCKYPENELFFTDVSSWKQTFIKVVDWFFIRFFVLDYIDLNRMANHFRETRPETIILVIVSADVSYKDYAAVEMSNINITGMGLG